MTPLSIASRTTSRSGSVTHANEVPNVFSVTDHLVVLHPEKKTLSDWPRHATQIRSFLTTCRPEAPLLPSPPRRGLSSAAVLHPVAHASDRLLQHTPQHRQASHDN